MREVFSNNAEGVLSDGISDSEITITLDDTPGAANFQYLNNGEFQRATISDLDAPGVTEIVRILGLDGLTLTVERGVEGSAPATWPSGAKLSARVTAGMLDSFVAQDSNGVVSTGSDPFVVNGRANMQGGLVQVAGWPALVLGRVNYSGQPISQDKGFSHEVVGGTQLVSLGTTPAWVSSQYYGSGSVVLPTTPNGFQYSYEKTPFGGATQVSTEPAFDTSGYPVAVVNPSDPDKIDGYWLPTPNPLGLRILLNGFSGGVMLTEVGFLCLEHGASTPPTISVAAGTVSEPLALVSGVSLSGIDGAEQVWRHVIADGGKLQNEIRFDVGTPATGTFVGRFYWRGVAFCTNW